MGINEFGSRLSFSQAMKKIESEDKGVLLLLSHSESSQEILSNISFLKGQKTSKNNEGPDSRIVGVGAQILKDLGIKKIRLLGASAKYPLTGFNLEITEFIN
jgi:3,4-dihydroxy 2-butanone 4-phosphate synthase/GTP cyclohydrolase II